MRITDLLKQEGILLNAAPTSKAEAIEMLISLHDKCGSLNDVAAFKEGILKREEMGTTAIGMEIAIPHAKSEAVNKTIKITIPEDLDYTGAFDDIFAEFTKKSELTRVKTTNMGSMFRLTYNVTLKDATQEKQMIDRIRERNGNLEIMVSKQETRVAEL